MGFFGNINPDEIPDGPRAGVYDAVITGVKVNHKSNKGGNFIVFEYTINDPGFDFPVRDWFSFPENPDPNSWDRTTPINAKGQTQFDKAMQDLKWFKRRLMDFGYSREQVNQINPDNLINLPIKVTIKMNDEGYPQVSSVAAIGATSGATLPTSAPAPTTTPAPAVAPQANFPASTPQPTFQAAAPAAAPPAGVNALTDTSANPFAGMS